MIYLKIVSSLVTTHYHWAWCSHSTAANYTRIFHRRFNGCKKTKRQCDACVKADKSNSVRCFLAVFSPIVAKDRSVEQQEVKMWSDLSAEKHFHLPWSETQTLKKCKVRVEGLKQFCFFLTSVSPQHHELCLCCIRDFHCIE